jgi:hypothetical protein
MTTTRRSRASAKKAGSEFERLIADAFAASVDDRIDRAVKRGTKDVGDVSGLRFHGHKIAVECKNEAGMKLPAWTAEAESERQNLAALAGVVVHKRHGKGKPGDQWVTMTMDNFIALMNLNREHIENDRAEEGPHSGPDRQADQGD